MNPRPKTHPLKLLRAQTVLLAKSRFPRPEDSRQAPGSGSFMVHGAGKAYRAHVLHSSTPHPRSWTSGVGRSLLKQRQEQRNRCSLIYKCPFYGCQAHPPAIQVSASPSKPVRPLVVAEVALVRGTAVAKGGCRTPHTLTSLLLSKSDPLRWAPIWLERGFSRRQSRREKF